MVRREQRLEQFFRCSWRRVQANSEEGRKRCGRCSQDEDWDKRRWEQKEGHLAGKGQIEVMGSLLGESSTSSDFGKLHAGCELDEWKIEKTTNQCSELKWTRRRFYLIKLISYSWVITSTCISTFTVIGMETLTILRTRPGKSDLRGTLFKQRRGSRPSVFILMGVGREEDKKVKNRVCAGWLIQVAETIGKQIGLQWKTVVEVARVLADEATIIEVELMTATEAVKAVMCLTRTQGRPNLISMVILLTNGQEGKRKTRGRRTLMMNMKMILQGVMKEDG